MASHTITYEELLAEVEREVRLHLQEAERAPDSVAVLMRHAAADSSVRLFAALARNNSRWRQDCGHLADLVCDIRLLLSASDALVALREANQGRARER